MRSAARFHEVMMPDTLFADDRILGRFDQRREPPACPSA
jgi:hypothetical protein